jgi:hypothetical protein
MINDASRDRIGGESRELLLRAIACLTMAKGPGGEGILSGQLPQELAPPFTRALLRIEAELLLNDADVFTAAIGEPRTQSERRADAFTSMILRLNS